MHAGSKCEKTIQTLWMVIDKGSIYCTYQSTTQVWAFREVNHYVEWPVLMSKRCRTCAGKKLLFNSRWKLNNSFLHYSLMNERLCQREKTRHRFNLLNGCVDRTGPIGTGFEHFSKLKITLLSNAYVYTNTHGISMQFHQQYFKAFIVITFI